MSVMDVRLILIQLFSLYAGQNLITCTSIIHGRYTRSVQNYQLAIPHKLTATGSFLTFALTHRYRHDAGQIEGERRRRRRRRQAALDGVQEEDEDDEVASPAAVHYGVTIDGVQHHLELWPNHGLIAPEAFVERRSAHLPVSERRLKKMTGRPCCHYTGRVRGMDGSRVAVSTCGGLAGYINTKSRRYYIEPLHGHTANRRGQLMHMVYEKDRNEDEQDERDESPAAAGDESDVFEDEGKLHCPRVRSAKLTSRCGTSSRHWEDSWRERFREQRDNNALVMEEDGKNEARRGLQSVHRYLETLVVADKKFLDHHRNADYDTYVMTIMNMVADYYHDASSGNQMDIVIVRLMYLEKEEEEIDLEISPDADKTLGSFCKWQQSVNPEDISNPNHHDIAVLLTRYDICADNLTSCGLMGLAFVATACTKDQPCAINEDAGLILGIVVAHEIGHVMGCSHDTVEESGCVAQAEDESFHVMSPVVRQNTMTWSTCSRTFITTFFNNDLGECLNDEPDISLYDSETMLPGAVYDATYQCQVSYPGSTVCTTDPDKFCSMLLCRTDPETCMSNGEPPADGTKCGENKWCYNRKCVEIGGRPEAINGGWGDWGGWSGCSRTCGAGVSYAERECNNPQPQHKGRYCIGDRKKIKLCNTHSCPPDAKSFRTIQCEEHDVKPFNDVLYTWRPYIKEDDPCSLYCMNNKNVYAKLEPRCKDGTRCKLGTKNMCVAGQCKRVGCDFVLDSDAVEDECGECRGDGTSCKLVNKVFNGPPGHGYVKVAVIFKGCRNILIEELKPSDNTLAIKDADEKKDFLNGNFTEEQDGVKEIGGVNGVYSHPEPNREMVLIHGPLKEDIVLFMVFFANENPGIRYKFAEPSTKAAYQPVYHWEFVEWGPCTSRCGGGSEIAEATCIEEKAGKVASSFCPVAEKPAPKSRICNEMPCKTKWRVGKWGKCIACHHESGMRRREVECIKEAKRPGAEDTLVEDNQCEGAKPGSKELCNSQRKCAKRRRSLEGSTDVEDFPRDMRRQLWLQSNGVMSWDKSYHIPYSRSTRKAPRQRTISKIASSSSRTAALPKSSLSKTSSPARHRKDEHAKEKDPKDVAADMKKKIGTIVADKIPDEAIREIAVPVKQSHASMNLSDEAFETVGDQVPDTLDFAHMRVMTGNAAANVMKQQAHINHTIECE